MERAPVPLELVALGALVGGGLTYMGAGRMTWGIIFGAGLGAATVYGAIVLGQELLYDRLADEVRAEDAAELAAAAPAAAGELEDEDEAGEPGEEEV